MLLKSISVLICYAQAALNNVALHHDDPLNESM
jgi:hypothetical protein